MEFINPKYVLKEENIYIVRKNEYEKLWENIQEIINVVTLPECGNFSIEELQIKENIREDKYELMPTKKGEIVIKLKKNNREIDLSVYYPLLIDEQYLFINGMQKIPLIQCFDIPIVTKGQTLKIRTNINTIFLNIQDKQNEERVLLQFSGSTVPLALIFLAKYGIEYVEKYLEEEVPYNNYKNNNYNKFLLDLKDYCNSSKEYTQKDFIEDIGKRTSRGGDVYSSGKEFLFKLDIILKIDICTRKFFESDSIIDEIVRILSISLVDDSNYENKRLRFLEYLILAPIMKIIYEFCITNHDTTKPKFNVNTKQILNECNVSEIVQFNFSYNPIEESSKLSRSSLLGPGGFKRDNVPPHLRDMDDSMYGRICAIDTPDRENCGIISSLIPNLNLDENLKFTNETSKQTVSTAISMIPFLEHNDPTRLQMASSQMRQAILLEKFQEPMIKSGCEGLYSDHTQFLKRAKKKGVVCKIDPKYIILFYEDGEIEILDISLRDIYSSNVDYYNICVNEGDKFNKDDIIIESQFMKEGNIVYGNNLFVGIMPYYGYNYEDGIVISEKLIKDNTLTSIHHIDLSFLLSNDKILLDLGLDKNENGIGEYMPLPLSLYDFSKKIDSLKRNYNEILRKTNLELEERKKLEDKYLSEFKKLEEKKILNFGPSNPYAIIQDAEKTEDFFNDSIKLYSHNNNTKIAKITLYANKWYRSKFPQFSNWIEKKLVEQQEEEKNFIKSLSEFANKQQLKTLIKKYNLDRFQLTMNGDRISQHNNFKIKGENINGIYFEISGLFRRPIMVGDKMGNRHGNKGVISKIIPEEKMPKVNGKPLDIILNPLGIISRMNLGQLFELHLSMSLFDLKQILFRMIKEKENQEKIKDYILNYIKIIDNTENNWYFDQFKKQLKDTNIDDYFVEDLNLIQAPFESVCYEKLVEAMKYTNTPMESEVYDPIIDKKILNPIAFGFMYFYRIIHIAEEKLSYRSIGPYTRRTLQPLRGRKNKGGQRLGEMEVACLIGHDALINLQECLTLKSDDIEQKNEWLKQITKATLDIDEGDGKVESVRLLESYLKVLGIEY